MRGEGGEGYERPATSRAAWPWLLFAAAVAAALALYFIYPPG
jgi:hypothetical protein